MTDSTIAFDKASFDEEVLSHLDSQLRDDRGRTQTDPILTVRDMGVYYGQKQALAGVNLDIPEHRITAFIGPSGCGKSTALRCFNRMNDEIPGVRVTGTISIDGQDIYGRDVNVTALRRAVGMVFQQPNPFPMSIFDNIALAVREQRGRVDRAELEGIVEQALTHANLWGEVKDSLKDSAFSLSGGQQQRLCIARALAVTPGIIMLDEPCASLDPISTAKIEDLLLELSSEYTIIIVTHNLAQAHRISDQVAFYLMGKLIEAGETREVFDRPRFEETGNYIQGRFG